MATTSKERSQRRPSSAAWRLDPASVTFELKVKPRQGAIIVAGAFRRIHGTLHVDSGAQHGIRAVIDSSSLHLHNDANDPRLRLRLRRALEAGPVMAFDSSGITEHALDGQPFRLAGQLTIRAHRVPLTFDVTLTRTGESLALTARVPVDHKQLGLPWLPSAQLKEPAELVVRAIFVPAVSPERRMFSSLRWQRTQPIPRRLAPRAIERSATENKAA